ncbi:MAG: ribonuclease P [bacterium ADurb.Bin400]|nr:MAG: ribonuclease P [bacterium ADurb.Bin400]
MLKSENRLKSEHAFNWVFRHSKPVYSNNLVFRVAKIPARLRGGITTSGKESSSPVRFGYIISSKVIKKATRRNDIKRKLRRISRELLPRIKPGYDVVVIVKRDFEYPYEQEAVSTQFISGLTKTGILE